MVVVCQLTRAMTEWGPKAALQLRAHPGLWKLREPSFLLSSSMCVVGCPYMPQHCLFYGNSYLLTAEYDGFAHWSE